MDHLCQPMNRLGNRSVSSPRCRTRFARPVTIALLTACALFAFCAAHGLAAPGPAATRFEGHVLDEVSGQPLAARVAITNVNGKFIELEGDHPHVQYLEKRWRYVDGSFVAQIPPAGAGLDPARVRDQPPDGHDPVRCQRWGHPQGIAHRHRVRPG